MWSTVVYAEGSVVAKTQVPSCQVNTVSKAKSVRDRPIKVEVLKYTFNYDEGL